ncbi:sister-chromatide cohesion complex Cohesin, subunit SA [Cyanidioschyzon merolae strain 10D]|uniref:Sister-chromatide cohesion complex Cohesin, subunit SA n=1 Tax=Cyanidioschyzon merolae (strain NIES-3377 / 10D) TaxID=280699 RepID=M1UUT8_CYAM1|nr:sister-chromatide cohesion complex Cohesin, subunit SA [Cyanidioschyzon merolae strain 10D]BAM81656.1 sister-chromatide cohesion complex Cohesin, subunit SA [Cyanidioschyzon merolae strain 10D]|eukprot:XP_005537692.1 sister-chromatide cohesion complex Cohesin, subunit SA [Cyanidioschyzon merolae strain 10D]
MEAALVDPVHQLRTDEEPIEQTRVPDLTTSPCSPRSASFTHQVHSGGGFLYDALRLRSADLSRPLSEFWSRASTDFKWTICELLELVVLAAHPVTLAEEPSCRSEILQLLADSVIEGPDRVATPENAKVLVDALSTAILPRISESELGRAALIPPLSATTRDARRFTQKYETCFQQLVQTCPESVWMDSDLIDAWVSWLAYLTESRLRAVRLAAVVAALHTVDGLLAVERALQDQAAAVQRNVVRNRSALEKIRLQTSDTQDLVKHLVQTVFAKRYRDVFADIRFHCISALGRWIRSAPARFLEDRFLKYLGWMIYDKDSKVRHAALDAILQLVSNPNYVVPMQAFLQRFRVRLVEMTRDREEQIAIQAIRLAQTLLPADWLGKAELEGVLDLITEDPRAPVRAAAGALSITYIELANSAYIQRFGVEHAPKAMLREIVFLILTANQNSYTRVCEALWHDAAITALCTWNAYVELLEEGEPDDGSEPLTDADRLALIRLWVAVAERVQCLEESSARCSTNPEGTFQPAVASTLLIAACREALPRLMRRFQSDPALVAALAQLVRLCSDAFHAHEEVIEPLLMDAFHRHAQSLEAMRAIVRALYALENRTENDSDSIPIRLQELLSTCCMHTLDVCTETRCNQLLAALEWISPKDSASMDGLRRVLYIVLAQRQAGSAKIPATVASLVCRILFLDVLWHASYSNDASADNEPQSAYEHWDLAFRSIWHVAQHDEDAQIVTTGLEVLLSLWSIAFGRGWAFGMETEETLSISVRDLFRDLLRARAVCDNAVLALCQRILIGPASVAMEAIPLLFLQPRSTGNDILAVAARWVHQRIRERRTLSQRVAVELAALQMSFDVDGHDGARRVASALSARYAFATSGDGVEALLDAVIDAALGFRADIPANPALAEAAGMALTSRLKPEVCVGAATRLYSRLEARGVDISSPDESDWWYPLWRLYRALLRDTRAETDQNVDSASVTGTGTPQAPTANAAA